ncbi:MAG: hypothetical protein K5762_06880 [Bacilli bacterium]|nr:hypothetical protein [Bacilli bacterium]
MLEKDHSPRSIRVRFTGIMTLVFLLGFIISLIITIQTGTKDDSGNVIYSSVGLGFNFFFTIGFGLFFLLFILFYIVRFVKQVKGPALKMTPKEEFKDEYDLGQHIADVETSKIPYLPFFQLSFYNYKKDILVLLPVSIFSLILGLYLTLAKVETRVGITLIVLFAVAFLISMILLFFLPWIDMLKQDNTLQKKLSIYQDKLYFEVDTFPQEFTFSMCHKSMENKDVLIFIFYRDGQKRFFFQKKDMDEKTFAFLQLKAQQVNNNN